MNDEHALYRRLCVHLFENIVSGKNSGYRSVASGGVYAQARTEFISQRSVYYDNIVRIFEQLAACVRRAARGILLILVALQQIADLFDESVSA